MNRNETKLRGRDLINIGIYAAIYFVILMAVAMLGMIPIFLPLLSVLVPILGGVRACCAGKIGRETERTADPRSPPRPGRINRIAARRRTFLPQTGRRFFCFVFLLLYFSQAKKEI